MKADLRISTKDYAADARGRTGRVFNGGAELPLCRALAGSSTAPPLNQFWANAIRFDRRAIAIPRRTPQGAYHCFRAPDMDVLLLENHILYKTEQPEGAKAEPGTTSAAFPWIDAP